MARLSGAAAPKRESSLMVDGLAVHVVRRQGQKTMRLRVLPPDGAVQVSTRFTTTDAEIRVFVRSHRAWIAEKQGQIVRNVQEAPGPPTDEELEAWRAHMKAAVPPLVDKYAAMMGVRPTRVTFRNMTSRWGSCRKDTGHITLNLQLAALPPECLESVVVHEMCHLIEANHSKRFWSLVYSCYPAYDDAKRLMKGAIRR